MKRNPTSGNMAWLVTGVAYGRKKVTAADVRRHRHAAHRVGVFSKAVAGGWRGMVAAASTHGTTYFLRNLFLRICT